MSILEARWTETADAAAHDASPEPRASYAGDDGLDERADARDVTHTVDRAALDLCIRADLWP